MAKTIYLNTTQLFIRYLKSKGMYSQYMKQLHMPIDLQNIIKDSKTADKDYLSYLPKSMIKDLCYKPFITVKNYFGIWETIDMEWVSKYSDNISKYNYISPNDVKNLMIWGS